MAADTYKAFGKPVPVLRNKTYRFYGIIILEYRNGFFRILKVIINYRVLSVTRHHRAGGELKTGVSICKKMNFLPQGRDEIRLIT